MAGERRRLLDPRILFHGFLVALGLVAGPAFGVDDPYLVLPEKKLLVRSAPNPGADPIADLYGDVLSHGDERFDEQGRLLRIWIDTEFETRGARHRVVMIEADAVDKTTGKPGGCHSCAPQIGAVTYRMTENVWTFASKQLGFTAFGSWGVAPKQENGKPTIVELSPGNIAFLVKAGFMGQGVVEGSTVILAYTENAWKDLGYMSSSGSNGGDCDESRGRACYSWEGTVSVERGQSGATFQDLKVTLKGTAEGGRTIVPGTSVIYRYINGQYIDYMREERKAAVAAAYAASKNGDNPAAIRLLLRHASAGDGESQYKLGQIYGDDKGGVFDLSESLRWLEAAADQYYNAREAIWKHFAAGHPVPVDAKKVLKWLRMAANDGYASAQIALGDVCLNGYGVPIDRAEAATWYGKAASSGNAEARRRLDTLTSLPARPVSLSPTEVAAEINRGIGLYNAGNFQAALKIIMPFASQGNPLAQNILGILYANGKGVAQSEEEAVKWYRESADQGNPYAMSNLAYCYQNGRGVEVDYKQASFWFRKSSDLGNVIAQYALSSNYYYGRGVTKDLVEANRWLQMAADNGYVIAQARLGYNYENGDGDMPKDLAVAAKWYRKAADQGYGIAQVNLAGLYERGDGVLKDEAEAFKLYGKAAKQNIAEADFGLGLMYLDGRGVAKNDAEAYRKIASAADRGYSPALVDLAYFNHHGIGTPKDDGEALRAMRKAAGQGDAKGKAGLKKLLAGRPLDMEDMYAATPNDGDADKE